MKANVLALLDLRNQTIDAYIEGRIDRPTTYADLDAITVELDRQISPDGRGRRAARAARVLSEILADSEARRVAVPPAKAARAEYWHQRGLDQRARDHSAAAEAERPEDAPIDPAVSDEVRMLRPLLASLQNRAARRLAAARVAALTERPRPVPDPRDLPPSSDVTWTDADRLTWEEMRDGVPCQGCGRPFLSDETSQGDHEPWPAYRERLAPIEDAFKGDHPDHGTRWTVGGGPFHCRRCCAPHPLSPSQIAELIRLMNPPAATPPVAPLVARRRCPTCHQPRDEGHVCDLADLPKALQAVVRAVLDRERATLPAEADDPADPAPGPR